MIEEAKAALSEAEKRLVEAHKAIEDKLAKVWDTTSKDLDDLFDHVEAFRTGEGLGAVPDEILAKFGHLCAAYADKTTDVLRELVADYEECKSDAERLALLGRLISDAKQLLGE